MRIRIKGVVLTATLLFSVLFLSVVIVQAKATRTDFSLIEKSCTAPRAPDRVWIEDRILHVRNQVYIFVIEKGELSGIVTFVSNVKFDLATGEDVKSGYNSFASEWLADGSLKGAIKRAGTSVREISEFNTPTMNIHEKFVAHGNSQIGQILIKGYYERRGPPLMGTILDGEIIGH